MIKQITLSLILSFLSPTMTYPVTAQELSSKDKKIIQEYNQSIEKGRRDFNEYSLPLCEFARWYSKSPKQPECTSFWTGWCWANRQPTIPVYDKPDGKVINALKTGRLLSISYGDKDLHVGRWMKVFGPYRNGSPNSIMLNYQENAKIITLFLQNFQKL